MGLDSLFQKPFNGTQLAEKIQVALDAVGIEYARSCQAEIRPIWSWLDVGSNEAFEGALQGSRSLAEG